MPTGLDALDRLLGGGLRPGKLYVIAARPSVGKSAFAWQLALTAAGQGVRVLTLSLEMRAEDLADRAVAHLGRAALDALVSGSSNDDEHWTRVVDAAELAATLPLWIDDQAGLTLHAINAKVRRHQQRHGLGLLVIDYLQLTEGTDRRANRNNQVEEISRGLKALSMDLNVPVIALSQLSRQATARDEPQLADLRDSGAIEQDGDVVMFLHPKAERADGSVLVAGILAKNRQGQRARVALDFDGSTQRWTGSTEDVSRTAGARQ